MVKILLNQNIIRIKYLIISKYCKYKKTFDLNNQYI